MDTSFVHAVLISLFGGLVIALNAYNKERRNDPPTFDWMDGFVLFISSIPSGMLGYGAASYYMQDFAVIYTATGLASLGGLGFIMALKDIFLDALKSKFVTKEPKPRPPRKHHEPPNYGDSHDE